MAKSKRNVNNRGENIFSYLHNDEPDMDIKDNTERKARKKLKEIDNLKKKDIKDLTDLEKDKIAKEKYWNNILNPEKEEEKRPSKKEEQKRLKKEKEKQKKEEEKKRKRKEKEELERQKQKQREEYQAEMNKQYEERKRQQEERKEEWKKQQEEWKKQQESPKIVISEIESEYLSQLKKYNGNKDKAFRNCSLKYHPDKNIGNEKKANENQKKLLEIHEKYS